ncbi:hypothetical protein EON62_04545 [archaeon]|nr:MAG: hypothetical protein EON62_04545 [archaeon]
MKKVSIDKISVAGKRVVCVEPVHRTEGVLRLYPLCCFPLLPASSSSSRPTARRRLPHTAAHARGL